MEKLNKLGVIDANILIYICNLMYMILTDYSHHERGLIIVSFNNCLSQKSNSGGYGWRRHD